MPYSARPAMLDPNASGPSANNRARSSIARRVTLPASQSSLSRLSGSANSSDGTAASKR